MKLLRGLVLSAVVMFSVSAMAKSPAETLLDTMGSLAGIYVGDKTLVNDAPVDLGQDLKDHRLVIARVDDKKVIIFEPQENQVTVYEAKGNETMKLTQISPDPTQNYEVEARVEENNLVFMTSSIKYSDDSDKAKEARKKRDQAENVTLAIIALAKGIALDVNKAPKLRTETYGPNRSVVQGTFLIDEKAKPVVSILVSLTPARD